MRDLVAARRWAYPKGRGSDRMPAGGRGANVRSCQMRCTWGILPPAQSRTTSPAAPAGTIRLRQRPRKALAPRISPWGPPLPTLPTPRPERARSAGPADPGQGHPPPAAGGRVRQGCRGGGRGAQTKGRGGDGGRLKARSEAGSRLCSGRTARAAIAATVLVSLWQRPGPRVLGPRT